jgi:PDZ domain-containing secreted protein
MNERIKELADLVGVSETYANKNGVFTLVSPELKKFAELIVNMCVQQIEKDLVPDEEVIEGYSDDWNMALRHGAEQIKEYFKVNN